MNLKGWAALILLPACAFAAYEFLTFPLNFLVAGAFLVVLVFLMATKYDPDSQGW